MGYTMESVDSLVTFPRTREKEAVQALRKLVTEDPRRTGGSSTGEKWMAFCNTANSNVWKSLKHALRQLRWQLDWNADDAPDSEFRTGTLTFLGEKLGDDELIFEALAKCGMVGSVDMEGGAYRDDAWRWVMEAGGLKRVS